MNWYALYVKSRHEFVADSELAEKRVETFLPTVRKLRQWKDRKKWVDFPLFPGYLFARVPAEPKHILSVLKTRGVLHILSNQPGCPTPVPDCEIDGLKFLIASGRDFDIYPHLHEGARVKIRKGALKGAEGVIAVRDEHHMFVVNVVLLGKSIGVRIYAEDMSAL